MRHTLLAIRNLWGEEKLAAVKARLDADTRAQVDKLPPLDEVPPNIVGAIHDALRVELGNAGWEASHDVGMEAARLEFGGIYRVLLRAVQYDTIWDRVERTWNHIVGRGAFKWHERRDGYVKAEIIGVTGFTPGIWHSAAGRCERLLTMSGAKSAEVHFIETLPTRALFEAHWVP